LNNLAVLFYAAAAVIGGLLGAGAMILSGLPPIWAFVGHSLGMLLALLACVIATSFHRSIQAEIERNDPRHWHR